MLKRQSFVEELGRAGMFPQQELSVLRIRDKMPVRYLQYGACDGYAVVGALALRHVVQPIDVPQQRPEDVVKWQ